MTAAGTTAVQLLLTQAVGPGIVAAVGTAAGIGSMSGVFQVGTAIGTAAGIGTAAASAQAIAAAVGIAGGVGSVTGVSMWTPALLSSSVLKAWYDFSDTATITNTGGAVDQVNDKSGNANHITGSTTTRPTTGTQTLNGLNVLVFDGTDDVLSKQSGTSLPSADPGAMLFVLRLVSSGTGGGFAWISSNAGSFGDNCVLGRDAGVTGAWGLQTADSTSIAAIYSDSDNTNWHLNGGVYTLTDRTIYQDGTSQNTNTGDVSAAASDKIFVGQVLSRNRGSNRFLNGRIAQVLVINGTDTMTRERIEGWALWKYGLQANLPGGHPYASAPP